MQKAAFTRKMTEFPCESLPFTCKLIVKSENTHAFSDEMTSMYGESDNFNGIFLPVASWIGVFSVLSLNKLRCSTCESLRSVYRSGCERPSSQFETELRSMPTCFATSICRKQSFILASLISFPRFSIVCSSLSFVVSRISAYKWLNVKILRVTQRYHTRKI